MGDILSIEGRTRPDLEKEEIVDALSRWLEKAKRGDIQVLAMTCILSDDSVLICSPRTHRAASIIGACVMLQQELLDNVEEVG